eukprot:c33243_g1_i1 orf=197-1576(+)
MSTSMVTQGSLGNTNPQNGGGMATAAVSTDNLTNQLAGMSKHQLYQIVSQMKDLIHQNQQQARQILIANPQLTKTLFQAQIMLGMVRAPDTLPPVPPASTPAQPPEQPLAQSQAPQVQPTPPPQSVTLVQPVPDQQPTSQQPPPQMASPYLQQSQASSGAVQPNQASFVYQQSVLPHQQTNPATNTVLPPSQLLPASALQPPLQHVVPPQPPLPLHPPPLPQQPRPLVVPPSQMQHQNTQGIAFSPHAAPQSYHPQPPYLQQGVPPQTNAGPPPFQQMHVPPLPSQPLLQHMFQLPRSRTDMGGNANIGSGGILPIGGALESGRGLSMGVPNTSAPMMTWNQTLPTSGPMGAPQVTPAGVAGHMVPGHHAFVGGSGLSSSLAPGPGSNPSQVFNPPLAQPQPPQQLQHQPQMQMPIELEQQKALLQQVMNLTPDQINSLPPEQRQQVLQLQQAFRSQTG